MNGKRCLLLMLSLLLGPLGCVNGSDEQGAAAASADKSSDSRASDVDHKSGDAFIAVACTQKTSRRDVILLESLDPKLTSGKNEVCIDASAVVPVNVDSIRVHAYSKEEAVLRLRCQSPELHKGMVERNGRLGALVVGGKQKAIALFHYIEPSDVADSCGEYALSNLEHALAICREVRLAGGADPDSCLDVCERQSQGVCTEVAGL